MRDITVIENERNLKQEELKAAEHNNFKVSQEILQLQREIIGLQARKKDLEISASKASHILKVLRIEIKQLENEFWNSKNV